MPNLDELFAGLHEFNAGVKQFQLGEAIRGASKQVQDINAQALKEDEKQAALQQTANNLTLQMQAIGAHPAEAASAAEAIDPMRETRQKLMLQHAQNLGMQALATTKAELKGSGGGLPLTGDMIQNIQKMDTQMLTLKGLSDNVAENKNLVGPVAGRIPGRGIVDPEYAAFKSQLGQYFDAYRVAVTGAGASPGELKMLKQNIPSETDPPEVFQKKSQTFLATYSKIRAKYLNNLKRAKRDVSGFEDTGGTGQPVDNTTPDDVVSRAQSYFK